MKVKTSDGNVHSFIKFYCEYFLKENVDFFNVISDIAHLRQIVKEIKDARLPKIAVSNAYDDLDRAFYRT